MEMRLAVPGAGAPSLTATALRDELQRRAGLGTTGTAIARFSDVSIVAPRGHRGARRARRDGEGHPEVGRRTPHCFAVAPR